MFRRLPTETNDWVTVHIDGEPSRVPAGETVACAVLAHGLLGTRLTPVTGSPRGPFCLMGACFECVMEIDGVPQRQACLTPVREGMSIRRMERVVPEDAR